MRAFLLHLFSDLMQTQLHKIDVCW